MSTTQDQQSISIEEARAHIVRTSFGHSSDGPTPGYVGLEPEFFPLRVDESGRPFERLTLHGERGDLEIVDELASSGALVLPLETTTGPPRYMLSNGGNVTFEPGGQIEHSTAAHESVGLALADVEGFLSELVPAVRKRDGRLAAIGIDVWNDVESVPLQLDHFRYRSMQAFFDRRGVFGRVMMRHTATTQINLDFGGEGIAEERYLLSNLVSPVVTASFACSPARGAAASFGEECVSARAVAWQGLDPTRSGFPASLISGSNSLTDAWADGVLSADVMLLRHGDTADVGEAGFSFERWLQEGHSARGFPTLDDLDYHLTTVFFEVRPRGFLELRAADGLPTRWRAAPVVFLCGLLYDKEARETALSEFECYRERLQGLWQRAARLGVRDPELASFAARAWEIALQGAGRLPKGYFRERDLEAGRAFAERYVARGSMPVDELVEALEISPEAGLAWAAETGE